jgi:hypothetical protein
MFLLRSCFVMRCWWSNDVHWSFQIGKFRRGQLSSEAHHELFATMTPVSVYTTQSCRKPIKKRKRKTMLVPRHNEHHEACSRSLHPSSSSLTSSRSSHTQSMTYHNEHHNIAIPMSCTSLPPKLKGLPSYNPACLKWQVRAPSDLLQPHTHGIAGLPQVLQYRLPNSFSE